ncbi:L-selectin-like isoform X1 [Sphaeramia orbicularis]|uniref:L-selectin-like isoform X1 n=2 Tax=Sphaeramia orbicularis TaxID=375764 RepID=UPI0011807F3A|nr:L-selectin-like isoform X1 [Sphaeramia orbicularis]
MLCFGSQTSASWISLTALCSMVCMRMSVDCWTYHYSENTMNWSQARAWCQEHHTDMVAIQNQEEIAHLDSWLPRKPTYYWIGLRKIHHVWTWVGTNKTLTGVETNWAIGEPNNGISRRTSEEEDCVEMYVKRQVQAGRWNDERCGKRKTALCYTASCQNDSCFYGNCVETINSHRCECSEGFYGEKCDQVHSPTVVQCPVLTYPAQGSVTCSDPMGPSSHGSTCVFTCDEGYTLSGPGTLRCEATGNWNASEPYCEV